MNSTKILTQLADSGLWLRLGDSAAPRARFAQQPRSASADLKEAGALIEELSG